MDNDTDTVLRIVIDDCLVSGVSKAAQSQRADENNGCSFQSNCFLSPSITCIGICLCILVKQLRLQ